ncbi:MAG: hypothetical protein DRQ55_12470 [Planctomycetota bacterium]|nr:MAG: hypothetical protein DRQ55_12470 [Planctomycetota bacterium]
MNSTSHPTRRTLLRGASLFAVAAVVPAGLWGCGRPGEDSADDGAAVVSANPDWEARARELESSGVLTATEPGEWAGKEASHLPQLSFTQGSGTVEVLTDHSMSPEHWITTHYVKNQAGVVIGLQEYAGTDAEARHGFELPAGTTRITAYSFCNRHGHWLGDASGV